MIFYVPPNLQNDFQDALNSQLGTSFIINFDKNNTTRAIVKEIDFRAKSDESIRNEKPMYADININIEIGDYLQDGNDTYVVTQLQKMTFPKCYKLFAHVCNNKITITTYHQALYDGQGAIISPEGDSNIVENIYCSVDEGSFQFASNSNGIGVVPTDEVTIALQYNDKTKNIDIGNNFYWFGKKYEIISTNYSQVDSDKGVGLLLFSGKKLTKNDSKA